MRSAVEAGDKLRRYPPFFLTNVLSRSSAAIGIFTLGDGGRTTRFGPLSRRMIPFPEVGT
jgi:hypothetical protein